MSQRLRVGVVGLRFGAQVHVPAFRADPRCEVVGIAGRDPATAAAAARDLGIPSSSGDWRTLVAEPGVDAIAVAVPPAAQPAILIEAARHGKHLFCEKPLAASLDDARGVIAGARVAGVVHAVDFLFPEVSAWRRARALLVEGAIGRPVHAAYTWRVETYASRTNAATWKNRPDEGGGALGNFMSHVFYNIEWLLGRVRAMEGFGSGPATRNGRAADGLVEVDAVQVENGTSGSVPVSVSVSTDAFLGVGHVVEIFGENGTLVLRNSGADYVKGFEVYLGTRRSGGLAQVPCEAASQAGDGRVAATASLVGRFVDAIHGGDPMVPNLAHAVRVQELLSGVVI